jgi:DivIVA domain-containing protein
MRADRVRQVFAGAGIDLTANEVAEALWLATYLPAATAPAAAEVRAAAAAAAPVPDDAEPTADPSPSHPPPPPMSPEPDGPRTPLFRREDEPEEIGGLAAAPVRVRSATAIPQQRQLTRALRPIKRMVESTRRVELDEEATVRRIAEQNLWLPALRPARDRWLDLAVVIEAGASGIWDQLGHELVALLRRLGAFRNVRVRYLREDAAGTPWISAVHATDAAGLRSPGELVDPTGRLLVLVVSDCVGTLWRNGKAPAMVRRWARSGPVAILQPLPERMWSRTSAGPVQGRLRSPGPGAAHDRLTFTSYVSTRGGGARSQIPVPILEIDAAWLNPWARFVAGATDNGIDATVTVAMSDGRPGLTPAPPTLSAEERVVGFRAQASAEAYRLAGYLSAAPLSLPVMRTVQAVMLPGTPTAVLAEVLYSGLVVPVDAGSDGRAEERFYDFVDGTRDVLLGTLRRHEAERVIDEVSAFIEQRWDTPGPELPAALPIPDGQLTLSAVAEPFARIRSDVLRRTRSGGIHAAAEPAAEPDSAVEADSSPEPGVVTPGPTVGQVLSETGGHAGWAFALTERYFVTCAHVVNVALGKPPSSWTWPQEPPVLLRVPALGDLRCTLAAWRPTSSVAIGDLDVAILRSPVLLPDGAPIARLAEAARPGAQPVQMLAIDVDGRTTAGVIDPHGNAVLLPGYLEKAAWRRASGQPVRDGASGDVIGMVQGMPDEPLLRPTFDMVPAWKIDGTLASYVLGRPPRLSAPPEVVDPEVVDNDDTDITQEIPRIRFGEGETGRRRYPVQASIERGTAGQRFRRRALRRGYKVDEVDYFLDRVEATLAGDAVDVPVTSQEVHDVVFRVRFGGYDEWQVDLHLDRRERELADLEERLGRGMRYDYEP